MSLVQRISKKSGGLFFGKSCTRDFGAPVCYPSTLIDVSNTAVAIKFLLKTICVISEGYRTHRGVTGPMNFKKIRNFFFGNSCSRDFGATDCYPSTLIDLANSALASRDLVETICKICEGYRTHRGVTGPMNFKSRTFLFFFVKSCSRDIGALAAI